MMMMMMVMTMMMIIMSCLHSHLTLPQDTFPSCLVWTLQERFMTQNHTNCLYEWELRSLQLARISWYAFSHHSKCPASTERSDISPCQYTALFTTQRSCIGSRGLRLPYYCQQNVCINSCHIASLQCKQKKSELFLLPFEGFFSWNFSFAVIHNFNVFIPRFLAQPITTSHATPVEEKRCEERYYVTPRNLVDHFNPLAPELFF